MAKPVCIKVHDESHLGDLIPTMILTVGTGVDGCYCAIKTDHCPPNMSDNTGNVLEFNPIASRLSKPFHFPCYHRTLTSYKYLLT